MPHPRNAPPRAFWAAVVAVLVTLGGCSNSGSGTDGGPVAFTVGAVDVQSARPPAPPLPDGVRSGVLSTLNRYLDTAVLGPLRSGKPAGDLAPVFTPAALARLTGPDRGALVDEGLPRADQVHSDVATASLGALAGTDRSIAVVAAAVDLRLRTGGGDSITIARTGDLVLVPVGGGWKIDSYDIRTSRDSGGATNTSAAH